MAKSKKNKKANKKQIVSKTVNLKRFNTRTNWMAIAVLCIATYWSFSPMLNNSLTNWDDNLYVTDNPMIQQWDNQTIGKMFTEPLAYNYHPLTAVSLNLNYQQGGFNPKPYLWTNLILHILNVVLVFYLIWLLTQGNFLISIGIAALFALHPMHVESVAWISERKDVLYAFFFLLGLIQYVRYVRTHRIPLLILCGFLFLLSLLSKPAAVVFPIVLVGFDVLLKRKMEKIIFIEKVPFLILSFIFGYITVTLQQDFVNNIKGASLTIIEKLMATGHAINQYSYKFLVPNNLSAFHSYPDLSDLSLLWIFPYGLMVIISYLIYRNKLNFEVWFFGVLFFIINLALVLPIVAIGEAIYSERYTYLPYIGLSFILFYYVNQILTQKSKNDFWKYAVYGGLALWSVILGYQTNQRTKVWKNSGTLWTNVMDQYPEVDKAYRNRGSYFMEQSQFELAQKDLEKAVELAEGVYASYYNLGLLYQKKGQIDEAIKYYEKAVEKNPSKYEPYNNLGGLYVNRGDYPRAIDYYNNALKANPERAAIWFNRGTAKFKLGDYADAAEDYKKGLEINPNDAEKTFYLALCFQNLGESENALRMFNKALSLNGAIGKYHFYYARFLQKEGKSDLALKSALKARELGYQVSDQFINDLKK